ncbi:fatty acid oxidation complex subunit alpha [Actinobacillus equuli]|nr:fatty acid oxidation complex subunit alpha [Actinobacillus equuli]
MIEQQEQTPVFQVEIDDNRIAIIRIQTLDNDANWLPEICQRTTQRYRQYHLSASSRRDFISARAHNFIQGFKPSILKEKRRNS